MSNIIINNYPLDDYQMELLKCNNNALLIAGAGSGKTFTILGKITYLIEYLKYNPEDILVISFTNASVNDIKKKIKHNINVYTFHKLAIHLLELNNTKYNLINDNLLDYIINEYLITINKEDKKILSKYFRIYDKQSINNFIKSFICLYKTNNYNYSNIVNSDYNKLEKKVLIIIFKIYKLYIEEKKSINAYDFDDLIIKSSNIVKNLKLNYKYIIIDEFQDTSLIRLNLIKEIYKYTNSKIIVVGDDWQSIYRFSGCDLNIFLDFNNIFTNVKKIYLKNTYRNSQELIDIASKFILKNNNQIKKELISNIHIDNPLIFVPYINKKNKLKELLNYLINITDDIMILIRNNSTINNYLDKELYINDNFIVYKNKTIKLYTVHKSKGLEAEYVIILDCNNNILGFPNKIENNSIINKLFTKKEIKYAEERRLFYVAITRCKNKVYLLYDKNNPSIFIKEIKKIVKYYLKVINYF